MPSRFQDMLQTQRLTPETSRAGMKWEQDEEEQLLRMVDQGVERAEIASTLKRSEGSIKTRLVIYAINKMDNQNMTVDDASKSVRISPEDVTEYLERKALRDEKKVKREDRPDTGLRTRQVRPPRQAGEYGNNVSNAEIYKLLYEINSKVQMLVEKH